MGVLRLKTKAGFSLGRVSNTICEFYFVWYKRPLKDSKDGCDMHRKGRRLGDRTIISSVAINKDRSGEIVAFRNVC